MPVYGNVNVKYAPCKSTAQLHSAADYILGQKKEQLSSGIIKTEPELYNAFGCNRDNFANSLLMTRKMHQKKYSRFFPRDILAQKLSISFHPDDNDKLTYKDAYKMAEDFAHEFFWKKGFEVLFAVHVDTNHVHVHFLVSNCNQKDGSSFRRGPKELVEMSKYFGEQCRSRGLTYSARDSFYNPDKTREERTFAESQIKKRGKLSFKDEIRIFVRLAMNDPTTQTIHDVVKMLERTYHMNVRLKGNTISYSLSYRSTNGGKVQAVRGSKLGHRFTVAGIKDYMKQKEQENWFEYPRQEQDIEHSSQSMKDYSRWQEDEDEEKEVKEPAPKTKKTAPDHEPQPTKNPDITSYEAYDEFQEKHEIPENDDTIFYGTAFDDFNKEWQGTDTSTGSAGTTVAITDDTPTDNIEDINSSAAPDLMKTFPSPSEYRKLSLEERAKLLPPPSDDRMEELSKYQDRMGYTEESMQSIRYEMSVYDDFNEEYDYRVKYNREHPSKEQTSMQEQTESQIAQEEQQPVIPPRRRGRGR
jgi:hypothetical protein